MPIRRWAFAAALLLMAATLTFPWTWRAWVTWRVARQTHTLETVPPHTVAIVFGARAFGDGRLSVMLRDRVDTAIALYKAGKVDKLLMSGDNRFADYNEPADMMAYAMRQGVPAEAMQPDYGGRRTYDTCYRARHIFQVESAILVTQAFHLPRALYTCRTLGIDAQGVPADQRTYRLSSITWSRARELAASIAALVDVTRRLPPPVMGEPIPIDPSPIPRINSPVFDADDNPP